MHEIFGPYQLIERLNSGGMAEIFKARTFGHSGFEKTLVIKRLHPRFTQTPEFVEMLKEEAKTAVGLSHSNIVQIFDLGRVQEHYYIAMEYINGRDLNQLMKRLKESGTRLAPEVALYLTSEVCAGLDYAHRKRDVSGKILRLIHRDVSPQNIMISIEGEVKIVDFGIAKSLASHQETEAGVIKGKFCFMSPEQARGQRVDHRTDIFSAGIMLYELLAGRPMYDSRDDHELLHLVRNAHFEPLEQIRPDLPASVHRVMKRALTVHRDDRYPSARHFQHGIEKVMQQSGLMFSRFQLGQFLNTHFPELIDRHDDPMRSFDDFDNEDLSLISDYELQRAPDDDWDIPEFTDEIEEMEFEELEQDEEEFIYPNQGPSSQEKQNAYSPSLVKRATPVPVGRAALPQAEVSNISYAPAAPPPTDPHLYDPRYGAPHRESGAGEYQGGLFHSSQAPIHRVDQLSPRELYSSEAPSIHPKRPTGSQGPNSFADDVESTMIFEEGTKGPVKKEPRPIYPERNLERGDSKQQKSRNGAHSWDWIADGKARLSSLSSTQQGQYILLAVFVISIIGLIQLGRIIFSPSRQSLSSQVVKMGISDSQRGQTIPLGQSQGIQLPAMQAQGMQAQGMQAQGMQAQGMQAQGMQAQGMQAQGQFQAALGSSGQPLISQSPSSSFGMTSGVQGRRGSRAQQGSVGTVTTEITTDPPGAEVAIDDQWQRGMTPIIAQLETGRTYRVVFSKTGYEELEQEFRPSFGDQYLQVRLRPQRGRLVINSNPSGARVTKDDQLIGLTPIDLDNQPLQPAEFRIEISKIGHKSRAYRLNWLSAEQGLLSLDVELAELEPPPQSEAPRRKPRRKRPQRQKPSRPSGSGFISIRSPQWGHLYIDNRYVQDGKIILKRKVSAGRHRVKFCFGGDQANCAQKSISVSNGAHEKVFF